MNDDNLIAYFDDIDLEQVDTSQRGTIEPIPAGEYLVEAIEGSVVAKDNGDAMIKLTFEIKDGPYANRKLWTNLNIRHSNPIAQRIAIEELTELWRDAMGRPGKPNGSDDLLWTPVIAKVSVEKRKDTGEMQNRIKKYLPATGAKASPKPAAPVATRPTAPAGRPAPSFLKKTG